MSVRGPDIPGQTCKTKVVSASYTSGLINIPGSDVDEDHNRWREPELIGNTEYMTDSGNFLFATCKRDFRVDR